MKKISSFHYITQDNILGYTHAQLAEEACMGGADWVQLRVKNKGSWEWKYMALEVQEVCRHYKATLIINDNVKLAKEIKADGVHLGKNDMSPVEARKILGDDFIIGGTANTFLDIERLYEEVDYIGLGPFRFTSTKENLSPVLGADAIWQIMNACAEEKISIPVIAIGGINPEDVESVLQAGSHGIAVASAVNNAENKEDAVKNFINRIKSFQNTFPHGTIDHSRKGI